MQFSEVERLAHEAYERGDVFGVLRLWREFASQTNDKVAAGKARIHLAEMWGRVGGVHPLRVRSELEQARRVLNTPADVAHVLAVAISLAVGENNPTETAATVARYREHMSKYPGDPEVYKWWPRLRTWLARLAVVQGDNAGAIEHLREALVELRTMEPDRDTRVNMTRQFNMLLAIRYHAAGDLEAMRACLDASDGSLHSANAEALRACAEVEYHLATGNPERARFFLGLAKSWSSGHPESLVQTAYVQAKLAYAGGNVKKAALLCAEARRLAGVHKQDALAGPIRALGKEICSATLAGQSADIVGGHTNAQSGVGDRGRLRGGDVGL